MGKTRRKAQSRQQSRPGSAPVQTGFGPQTGGPDRLGRAGGFNPDYTHVRRDLKRIGLLAGTFITLLIVASLFVR